MTTAPQLGVRINGQTVPIDRAVFVELLENSVASSYVGYEKALQSGAITFSDLVELARRGQIPYCLFFASLPLVREQVAAKTRKLLAGITKHTFSINSRDVVEMRDVELIVKDLLRKQELLKRCDSTLTKNSIVGLLGRPGTSPAADADKLMAELGLTHQAIIAAGDKTAALAHIITRLEANQVLVSQSAPSVMPQRLTVGFSGLTIKDAKVPYVFLAGGDPGDYQEPVGRRIFTLTLLAVLVARKIFAPVTYDGSSVEQDVGREYDIVGEILMPATQFQGLRLGSLDDVKTVSDYFKVTASAVAVRAMRLGVLDGAVTKRYLDELRREYEQISRPPMRSPLVVNALRKYNGRELSLRMLDALDTGKVSAKDFCRVVCLNHIQPAQIDDYRQAVR
ncbi:hypothetical protein GII32_10745 [Gordonia amarae]|uniref:hypothetical protein n=1 Tax=Gordonia amarae TaxID=36821 RepID=UPI001AFC74DE|nr:hypothetical protein [Gordonia amarae]QHN30795.1 hypothetical protein GII32_10745 [Gordonia amarae]